MQLADALQIVCFHSLNVSIVVLSSKEESHPNVWVHREILKIIIRAPILCGHDYKKKKKKNKTEY